MVDASLLAYAAVSYVRHKYEDYCSESEGHTYKSDVGSEARGHGGSIRLARKVSELF